VGTSLAGTEGVPKTMSVLVVDDDAEWRDALTEGLVAEGYVVATAENGSEALALLSTLEPDVIVTDLQMPIMDGHHLLAAVEKRGQRIPVIVVTGDYGCAAAGHDLDGAFRVIDKPAPLELLLAAVAEASVPVPVATPPSRHTEKRRRLFAPFMRRSPKTKFFVMTVFALSSLLLLNHVRLALGTSA
jgi:CheY-like chemotaxis protein